MQSVRNDRAHKTKGVSRHRGDNVRESHTMLGKLAIYLRSVRFHRYVTQHPVQFGNIPMISSLASPGTAVSVKPKGHVTRRSIACLHNRSLTLKTRGNFI